MYHRLLQPINYLYVIEVDDDTTSSTARDIRDFVCLDGHLHIFEGCYYWQLDVITWLSNRIQQGATSKVDAHVAFLNDVEAIKDDQNHR